MEFSASKQGDFLVLAPKGRMDAITAPRFEAECDTHLQAGEKRIVVDMSGLEYISSAGLRSILASAKKLKAQGGDLAFCCLSGIVAEVFAVSGFSKLLPVLASLDDAVSRS